MATPTNANNVQAGASDDASHQPPTATIASLRVDASTGPPTFAAPCEAKYRQVPSPKKANAGPAHAKYEFAAAVTPGSLVNSETHSAGLIATITPTRPTVKPAAAPAVHATCRARDTSPAPIAMPTIGTEATPNANEIGINRNSRREPMP